MRRGDGSRFAGGTVQYSIGVEMDGVVWNEYVDVCRYGYKFLFFFFFLFPFSCWLLAIDVSV